MREDLFDWTMFGSVIRITRRILGYRKASEFSDAIVDITGYSITADTLYKIESGKQAPSAMQLFAIMLALGVTADNFSSVVGDTMMACSRGEWKKIAKEWRANERE